MTKIYVKYDFRRFTTFLKDLSKSALKSAVRRSIKRTLVSTRTYSAKTFKAEQLLRMKSSEIKQRIKKYDNTGAGKSVEEMSGKIWIGSREESLGRFFAKAIGPRRGNSPQGAQVTVLGKTYAVARAFLWERPGARAPLLLQRVDTGRTPLIKPTGPGMSELMQKSGLLSGIRAKAAETYEKEFKQNLKYYAEKAMRKGDQ